MLKCRDVGQQIGTDGIQHSGLMKRLAVRLHLMMCRHCRAYARQIRAIGKAARDINASSADPTTVARMKRRITDR
jgi:anti-sigma factor ChrR (cupin superfamily)